MSNTIFNPFTKTQTSIGSSPFVNVYNQNAKQGIGIQDKNSNLLFNPFSINNSMPNVQHTNNQPIIANQSYIQSSTINAFNKIPMGTGSIIPISQTNHLPYSNNGISTNLNTSNFPAPLGYTNNFNNNISPNLSSNNSIWNPNQLVSSNPSNKGVNDATNEFSYNNNVPKKGTTEAQHFMEHIFEETDYESGNKLFSRTLKSIEGKKAYSIFSKEELRAIDYKLKKSSQFQISTFPNLGMNPLNMQYQQTGYSNNIFNQQIAPPNTTVATPLFQSNSILRPTQDNNYIATANTISNFSLNSGNNVSFPGLSLNDNSSNQMSNNNQGVNNFLVRPSAVSFNSLNPWNNNNYLNNQYQNMQHAINISQLEEHNKKLNEDYLGVKQIFEQIKPELDYESIFKRIDEQDKFSEIEAQNMQIYSNKLSNFKAYKSLFSQDKNLLQYHLNNQSSNIQPSKSIGIKSQFSWTTQSLQNSNKKGSTELLMDNPVQKMYSDPLIENAGAGSYTTKANTYNLIETPPRSQKKTFENPIMTRQDLSKEFKKFPSISNFSTNSIMVSNPNETQFSKQQETTGTFNNPRNDLLVTFNENDELLPGICLIRSRINYRENKEFDGLLVDILASDDIKVSQLKEGILYKLVQCNIVDPSEELGAQDVMIVTKVGNLLDEDLIKGIPYLTYLVSESEIENTDDEYKFFGNVVEFYINSQTPKEIKGNMSRTQLDDSISSIDENEDKVETSKSRKEDSKKPTSTEREIGEFKINFEEESKALSTSAFNPFDKPYNSRLNENSKAYLFDDYAPKCTTLDSSPIISELNNMTKDELRTVSNFKLSNQFGSVEFLAPVDLTYQNIDKIVSISELCLTIYKDSAIPAKYEKLNCPVKITLYKMYPPVSAMRNQNIFSLFLEELIEELHYKKASFIEYSPQEDYKLIFQKECLDPTVF